MIEESRELKAMEMFLCVWIECSIEAFINRYVSLTSGSTLVFSCMCDKWVESRMLWKRSLVFPLYVCC